MGTNKMPLMPRPSDHSKKVQVTARHKDHRQDTVHRIYHLP